MCLFLYVLASLLYGSAGGLCRRREICSMHQKGGLETREMHRFMKINSPIAFSPFAENDTPLKMELLSLPQNKDRTLLSKMQKSSYATCKIETFVVHFHTLLLTRGQGDHCADNSGKGPAASHGCHVFNSSSSSSLPSIGDLEMEGKTSRSIERRGAI